MDDKKIKPQEFIDKINEESDSNEEYSSDHYSSVVNKAFMSEAMANQTIIESDFNPSETELIKDENLNKLFNDSFSKNAGISIKFFYKDVIKKVLFLLPFMMVLSAMVLSVYGGFGMGSIVSSDPYGIKLATNRIAFLGIAICFSIPSIFIAIGFLPNMIINKKSNNTLSRMRLQGFNKHQLLLFLFTWTFTTMFIFQLLIWQIWVPLFSSFISSGDKISSNVVNITDKNWILFIIQWFLTNSIYIVIGFVIGFWIKNSRVYMSIFTLFIAFMVFYLLLIVSDAFADTPLSMMYAESTAGKFASLLCWFFIYFPTNLIQHGFVLANHDLNNFRPENNIFIDSAGNERSPNWVAVTHSSYIMNELVTILFNTTFITLFVVYRNKIINFA